MSIRSAKISNPIAAISRRWFFGALGAAWHALRPLRAATPPVIGRHPYLQNLTRDKASILWTTATPSDGSVAISENGVERVITATVSEFAPSRTGLAASYFQYEAKLSGLKPGTLYRYRLLADGQELGTPLINRPLQFRTADDGPFSFLHFADSGTGDGIQAQVAKQMGEEAVSLVLANGDLAYPTATYEALDTLYFSRYATQMARVPFFPSLGNHDNDIEAGEPLLTSHSLPMQDVTRGRYYSFDWGNAHFVCLDSNDSLTLAAEGKGSMLEWLDRDLAATRKYWRIVFYHHPGQATGDHENEGEAERVRTFIVPILEKHGVQLVLNGHEHSYQRTVPLRENRRQSPDLDGSIVYIVSGGAGAPVYSVARRPPQLAVAESRNHYLRCEVEADNLLVRAIASGTGEEFDRVRIAPAPRVAGAVLDSASYSTSIGRGGLVTLFGHHLCTAIQSSTGEMMPVQVAETTVTIDGRPIPILYASATQINLRLPFEVEGTVDLLIRTPNGTDTVTFEVAPVAPMIFSVPGPGVSLAFATRSDGTLINLIAPATSQQAVTLWLTGMGLVTGPLPSPRAVPTANSPVAARVEVWVGDVRVDVMSAVLAAGSVGIYQVSVVLPALNSGLAPIKVVAAGVSSNSLFLPIR